jgi:hypothetical protein
VGTVARVPFGVGGGGVVDADFVELEQPTIAISIADIFSAVTTAILIVF